MEPARAWDVVILGAYQKDVGLVGQEWARRTRQEQHNDPGQTELSIIIAQSQTSTHKPSSIRPPIRLN